MRLNHWSRNPEKAPAMPATARSLILSILLASTAMACGGGAKTDTADTAGTGTPSSAETSTIPAPDETTSTDTPAASGRDACSALPRATIAEVAGADPGEGELEHAARNTICRYYGDAQVTVEIDPGSDVAQARVSVEAYGDKCEPSSDIGKESLWCTGGFKAQGFTGQIVWTDGERTMYVVYNSGDAAPTRDIPLELARRLQP